MGLLDLLGVDVRVRVGDRVALRVPVLLRDAVMGGVLDSLFVGLDVGLFVMLGVGRDVPLLVLEGPRDWEGVIEPVPVPVGIGVPVIGGVPVSEADPD